MSTRGNDTSETPNRLQLSGVHLSLIDKNFLCCIFVPSWRNCSVSRWCCCSHDFGSQSICIISGSQAVPTSVVLLHFLLERRIAEQWSVGLVHEGVWSEIEKKMSETTGSALVFFHVFVINFPPNNLCRSIVWWFLKHRHCFPGVETRFACTLSRLAGVLHTSI